MKTTILLTSGLALAFTGHTASAALVFSDNFNVADGGLNTDLASRQSGPAATQSYSTGGVGTKAISSNYLELDGSSPQAPDNNAWVAYDFATDPNLLTNGAFKVTFDLWHDSRSYAAFAIGATASPGDRPLIASNTDIGILMEQSGRVSTFEGGSGEFDNLSAVTAFPDQFAPVEITVTTDNFNSGTAFTFDLSINGESVALGAAANGTWDANGTNYLVFSSRSSTKNTNDNDFTRFDNFEVTAIPEPGSLTLLLGLGALAMTLLRLRRR